MTTSTAPSGVPVPVRYAALDLLRGIAIIGTLATNIWLFTNPEGMIGYLNDVTAASTPPGWAAVEAVLQQLAQGKFLGLLTIMFGIGLEIQRRSAVRGGRPWPGRYPWRAALLLLDGMINFVLVVEFDVLSGYAITGLVVAYLLATSERAQRRWLVTTATVHVLMLAVITAVLLALPPITGSPAPLDPNPYANGSWLDLVRFRLENIVLFRLEPVFIAGLSVAMFLAGSQLVRRGVLDESGRRLRARLMVLGAAAWVVDLVIGLGGGAAGVVLGRYGTAPLVALGLLAAVTELVRRYPRNGFLRRRVIDLGRAALSAYIGQNLLASALCYGWGLGLASRMTAEQRVPGTMMIFVLTIVITGAAASLWLRRFDRGPVELAWRWCFDRIDAALPPRRPSGQRDRPHELVNRE